MTTPLSFRTSVPGGAPDGASTAAARQIVSWPVGALATAPGHALHPRIRFTSSRAGRARSRWPSVFLSRGASVAASWRCGVGVSVSRRASVSTRSPAPSAARRAASSPAVSSTPIGVVADVRMGPVSMPSSIWNVVTPVTVSPRMIAHWIGAAPRYRGRSEAWTLMEPRVGTWSTDFGRICPKATTTATSGRNSARRPGHSGSRSRAGCTTGSPAASARTLTGGGVRRRPRCAGRSGWVTTATTSCRRRSASRVGSANSGVP